MFGGEIKEKRIKGIPKNPVNKEYSTSCSNVRHPKTPAKRTKKKEEGSLEK
jgi:hypothetical protein